MVEINERELSSRKSVRNQQKKDLQRLWKWQR